MADFEALVGKHVGADGSIPASAILGLVSAIKQEVGNGFVDKARYKAKLDELETAKTEKQTAEDAATASGAWKDKHDALKGEFDAYKTAQTAKETRQTKEAAYRDILKTAGISEKRLEAVLRVSADKVDALELADGKAKDAAKLVETVRADWADFVVTTDQQGSPPATPPAGGGGGKEAELIARVRSAMGLSEAGKDESKKE